MKVAVANGGMEPIGKRIVELPENERGLLYRDSHSGFVAYVPIGSIAAGRRLVEARDSAKTVACAGCHGPQMAGVGDVPAIAGRPPTYIVRQLWNYQHGDRRGPAATAMHVVVEKLAVDDMLAIAAYVASQPPD